LALRSNNYKTSVYNTAGIAVLTYAALAAIPITANDAELKEGV
jgi:hypothetical protein